MPGIELVARDMCEECEAFLGKQHNPRCSMAGEVIPEQAVEKFTTIEHAEQEQPLIGLDTDTVELLQKWLGELDLDEPEEIEKLQALQLAFAEFVAVHGDPES